MKNNECRIIKVDKDALFEFIYETMIDNLEEFFDVLDCTKVTSHHQFNPETGEYIYLVKNSEAELDSDIDLNRLLSKLNRTTSTLYSDGRYKEMTFDEIRSLLK